MTLRLGLPSINRALSGMACPDPTAAEFGGLIITGCTSAVLTACLCLMQAGPASGNACRPVQADLWAACTRCGSVQHDIELFAQRSTQALTKQRYMTAGTTLPRPDSALSAGAEGQGHPSPPCPGQVVAAPTWLELCGPSPTPSKSVLEEGAERTGDGASDTTESAVATLPPRYGLCILSPIHMAFDIS